MAQALQGQLQSSIQTAMSTYLQTVMTAYMQQMSAALQTQVSAAMQQSMSQLSTNMANAMSIDEAAFADAFQMNMTEEDLGELIMSLMSTEDASYDGNLKKLGYADVAKPSGIDIYPIDFESKEHVIDILDTYNNRMADEGQDDKVITYTDFVGALMSSVTDIVNMISYVLVAFVAISLVVSSIMIGVITYISVLERKKEIGILRSIGASKGDISRVFNAETIIVGFTAGVIGIGLTALACIPANAIVYALFNVANVAALPWQAALVLVGISVFLTFLAGLIPSSAASRKDPVEALRSEVAMLHRDRGIPVAVQRPKPPKPLSRRTAPSRFADDHTKEVRQWHPPIRSASSKTANWERKSLLLPRSSCPSWDYAACCFLIKRKKHCPYLLGIPMVVSGVSSIAVSLYKRDAEAGPASIGGAIILCVLGAITMTHGSTSTSFIGILWGLIGLSKAAVEFNEIADAIREKEPFAPSLAVCVFELALAVLLIINPVANIEHHLLLLGIELIIYPFKLHRKRGKLILEAEA